MQREQHHIEEFMTKAAQACPDRPTVPDLDVRKLRLKLILEETLELAEAYGLHLTVGGAVLHHDEVRYCENGTKPNLRDAYDAALDILVVTIGTGVAMGTQLEPGWEEIQRSNMSKFIDGHRRADGKWQKGPSYSPADLQPILDAQTLAAEERDRQAKLFTSPEAQTP